jgi:hypothetical protein
MEKRRRPASSKRSGASVNRLWKELTTTTERRTTTDRQPFTIQRILPGDLHIVDSYYIEISGMIKCRARCHRRPEDFHLPMIGLVKIMADDTILSTRKRQTLMKQMHIRRMTMAMRGPGGPRWRSAV